VLPNKEYIPGVVHEESLRNLQYPLDWQGLVDYIGMPCILKDAHGGGWKDVYVCRSLEELIHHYDTSGLLTMIVQEFIEWDQFIRCICIGQEKVMPIKYDPKERRYHVEHEHMTPELGQRVIADSLKLVRALGYDMNSMEWAVRDGIPYAIDFMNPAPDMDIYSLTPHYFEWAVESMADMAISLAKNPRRQVRELRWDALFTGSRETGEGTSESTAGSASAGFAAGAGGAASPASADDGQHGSGTGGRTSATDTTAEGAPLAGGTQTAVDFGAEGSGLFGSARADDAGSSAEPAEAATGFGAETQPMADAAPAAPIQRTAPATYVDESPAADLEPPLETQTRETGSDTEARADSGGAGNGRAQAPGDPA
jgi:hypothetical protein